MTFHRYRLLTLSLALLLAACSSSHKVSTQPVVASFQPGATDTVTVDVLDPEAAEQIELVAPDGTVCHRLPHRPREGHRQL